MIQCEALSYKIAVIFLERKALLASLTVLELLKYIERKS